LGWIKTEEKGTEMIRFNPYKKKIFQTAIKNQAGIPIIALTITLGIILTACFAFQTVDDLEKPLLFTNSPEIDEEITQLLIAVTGTETEWIYYLPLISSDIRNIPPGEGWPTIAANPQRTSWTSEEVTGNLKVDWFRPIEAYIPQNVQLIASDGLIFVSTSAGLYALEAVTGELAWRFDTTLPLGNSPTVSKGVVYVGGYDRKLHALRASDGAYLWSFDGATAGYSANPLVVEGKVIAANRDGKIYAIGEHGSPAQGLLIWEFEAGGIIDLSPAYNNGTIYFAAMDNHAYAVSISNGSLLWKSEKLPGDGYQSYWPVIFQNHVIFSAASGYRTGNNPGTGSLMDLDGNYYGKIFDIERDALFSGLPDRALIGEPVQDQDWARGKQVLDASRIAQYLEDNPNSDPNYHKPWRRVLIVLNQQDGDEYTFDSDNDGYPGYTPITMWGTHSGTIFPPLAGPDGILYVNNILQKSHIPQGRVMGWKPGTTFFSQIGGQGAVDEPQALSAGGETIYRVICCDRVGDWFSISSNRRGTLWDYSRTLSMQIPGYDIMWYGMDPNDSVRLRGNYGTQNGIYHNHGDQNPLIPYNGRLYVHRSNAVIAFGSDTVTNPLPLLEKQTGSVSSTPLPLEDLKTALEVEIQKMLDAGHLRPGYYNSGQMQYPQFANYFENPGDTLYTLALAIPHLPPQLKTQKEAYLQNHYQSYFVEEMYTSIGWADGAARDSIPLPDDIQEAAAAIEPSTASNPRLSWSYPPFNFYALWKYSQIFPQDALQAYNLSKSKLQVPVPQNATDEYLELRPFEMNAYIAGYIGFLELQTLAGMTGEDSALRVQVNNELNRLLQLRTSTFSKDSPWVDGFGSYHLRTFNISRNFLFLVPELGDYMHQNTFLKVQEAVVEYNYTAPYWFVARFNAVVNEGVRQNLYDYPAMFQAKAFILNEPQEELVKYLDVPAFARGDLFYIQNLVAAIEADD
jgi:outer membrane protein assembly factor BamB